MNKQNLIEKYFEQCNEINNQFNPQISVLQQAKSQQLSAALDEFIDHLKNLLPPKLLKKVERNFTFGRQKEKGKHFLRSLIREGSTQSIGVTKLRNITLSKDEITELNKFWSPMVNLNPTYMSFSVQLTEQSKQAAKLFFKMAGEMQSRRDF